MAPRKKTAATTAPATVTVTADPPLTLAINGTYLALDHTPREVPAHPKILTHLAAGRLVQTDA